MLPRQSVNERLLFFGKLKENRLFLVGHESLPCGYRAEIEGGGNHAKLGYLQSLRNVHPPVSHVCYATFPFTR